LFRGARSAGQGPYHGISMIDHRMNKSMNRKLNRISGSLPHHQWRNMTERRRFMNRKNSGVLPRDGSQPVPISFDQNRP
jgi:hypothetical protein